MRTPLPPEFLTVPLAHRAYHDKTAGRPENSRAAFRAAIAQGYGIETDLQLSADGVAMVFHDYDLKRLTGQAGRVRGKDAAALARIGLRHADEGIPTLAEILDLVDGRVPLLLEMKDQDGAMGPDTGELEAATAKALAGYEGKVAVMSFNPHAVAAFAAAAPGIPVGLTTAAFTQANWPLLPAATRRYLRTIPDFDRVGAGFVSHDARDLSSPHLARLRNLGVPVLCWTIRSPAEEAQARRIAGNITFEGYPARHPAA